MASMPPAKRPKVQLQQLQKRLKLEGVAFKTNSKLPSLLALANEQGFLTLHWPEQPPLSLLDLPNHLIETILLKTFDGFRWHRQSANLVKIARFVIAATTLQFLAVQPRVIPQRFAPTACTA